MEFNQVVTKGGDTGYTSLFNGDRVSKDCINIESIGDLDELTASLSVVLTQGNYSFLSDVSEDLGDIQLNLWKLSAAIATPKLSEQYKDLPLLKESDIIQLEHNIKYHMDNINIPTKFTFATYSKIAAFLDLSRTICRRAERSLLKLIRAGFSTDDLNIGLKYLNRLSDFLYILRITYDE